MQKCVRLVKMHVADWICGWPVAPAGMKMQNVSGLKILKSLFIFKRHTRTMPHTYTYTNLIIIFDLFLSLFRLVKLRRPRSSAVCPIHNWYNTISTKHMMYPIHILFSSSYWKCRPKPMQTSKSEHRSAYCMLQIHDYANSMPLCSLDQFCLSTFYSKIKWKFK